MFILKTLTKITTLGLVLAIGLAGCVSTSGNSTIRPPTDNLLAKYKGNLEGLYNAWIVPYKNAYGTIQQKDMEQYNSTKNVIADGFSQFCEMNDWTNNHEKIQYGDIYTCTDRNGELAGEINVKRGNMYTLEVTLNPNKLIKKNEIEYYFQKYIISQIANTKKRIYSSKKYYEAIRSDNLLEVALEKKLRPKLNADLKSYLTRITQSTSCENTEVHNDVILEKDLNIIFECRLASLELNMLNENMYSLSTNNTPLSMHYASGLWTHDNRDMLTAEAERMKMEKVNERKSYAKNTISKSENIGRKICNDGQLTYNQAQKGPGQLIGFLEGMSQDGFRIQFRVLGWSQSDRRTYYSSGNPRFGNFNTEPGLVYWDDVSNWYLCS